MSDSDGLVDVARDKRGWSTFTRSQVSAMAATAVDFSVLFVLVEVFRVWYLGANAIGAASGAISNFYLNRFWTFNGGFGSTRQQIFRYLMVSGASLALNSAGVGAFTEFLKFPYAGSKLISSLLVGVLFNYPMHRGFVFRFHRLERDTR